MLSSVPDMTVVKMLLFFCAVCVMFGNIQGFTFLFF